MLPAGWSPQNRTLSSFTSKIPMAKPTDRDRLLWLLNEEGGTSNQQAKTILNVSDQRYGLLKEELLSEALIEKYRCHSGGIALTAKGVKHLVPSPESAVGKEADLYQELIKVIDNEAYDNEENAFGFDIGSLRNRGKWTNPDVVKFSVRNYPRQRIDKLIVTTYLRSKAMAKMECRSYL